MAQKVAKRNKKIQDAKNTVICYLLTEFRNNACAMQSQSKADNIRDELKEFITEDEHFKLRIAHTHFVLGEGPEELYGICKELRVKYGGETFADAVDNFKTEFAKALKIPQIVEWLANRLPKKYLR